MRRAMPADTVSSTGYQALTSRNDSRQAMAGTAGQLSHIIRDR